MQAVAQVAAGAAEEALDRHRGAIQDSRDFLVVLMLVFAQDDGDPLVITWDDGTGSGSFADTSWDAATGLAKATWTAPAAAGTLARARARVLPCIARTNSYP